MKMSPAKPGISHTLPSKFQGKPLSANCRARSPITQKAASTATRRQPAGISRAAPQGTAMNSARNVASSGTVIGTAHQNSAAITRIALVIQ